jgi:hypothetical protein
MFTMVAPRVLWSVGRAKHSNLPFARDELPVHHAAEPSL